MEQVEITSWISEVEENERVKKILRLWFSLFTPFNKQDWTAYP
jgi:hypothetical protein